MKNSFRSKRKLLFPVLEKYIVTDSDSVYFGFDIMSDISHGDSFDRLYKLEEKMKKNDIFIDIFLQAKFANIVYYGPGFLNSQDEIQDYISRLTLTRAENAVNHLNTIKHNLALFL